jgi:uncharacterized protein YecE (DUF72 family)
VRVWVGTSGWQYRDWRGTFYPDGLAHDRWLEAYAKRFPTVELNNSFYRLPEASTFARWRDRTPVGFVMSVKVSRYLTHVLRLQRPTEPIRRLWYRASELGPRLGPLLFQLPPRFPAEPERLGRLLDALPSGARAAFEFRDPSWLIDDVLDQLRRADAALVWPDSPGRRRGELPVTASWAYVRFHRGRRADPHYDRRTLRTWAHRLADLPVDEAWAYFNNDEGGAAPRDAARLIQLLRDRLGDAVVTA